MNFVNWSRFFVQFMMTELLTLPLIPLVWDEQLGIIFHLTGVRMQHLINILDGRLDTLSCNSHIVANPKPLNNDVDI